MVDDTQVSDERLLRAELKIDYLQNDFEKVLGELKTLNANMSQLIAIKKDVDSVAEKQRNLESKLELHLKEEFKPLTNAVNRNTQVVIIVSSLASIATTAVVGTSISMLFK